MNQILIVDDSKEELGTISSLVSALYPGALIVRQDNWSKAIEDIECGEIDLVITDFRMPPKWRHAEPSDCQGKMVVEAAASKFIPVILISGDMSDSVKNLVPRANAYLQKPFSNVELEEAIKEAIHCASLSR